MNSNPLTTCSYGSLNCLLLQVKNTWLAPPNGNGLKLPINQFREGKDSLVLGGLCVHASARVRE